MTLAAQLARRRRIVGASAARRGVAPKPKPKPVPLAQPPRGAIVAYTSALLSVSDELDAAIHHELVQARVIPRTDGAADGVTPAMLPGHAANVATRLQRVVDHILSKRSLLSVLDGVAGMTAAWSKEQFAKQVRAVMGVDLPAGDPHFGAMFADFRAQNVALIKSLAAEKVSRVHKVLTEAGSSTRVEEIAKQIRDETGATKARAALIARDQVLSLNAQVTQARHVAAGITSYIWRTSGDERVRPAHKALEGQQFKYGEPPIVDPKSGRRDEPGQDFQCRCTAEPIIDALVTPVSPEALSTLARVPQVPVEAPPLPTLQAPVVVPLPPEIAAHMVPTVPPTLVAPPAASKPKATKKPAVAKAPASTPAASTAPPVEPAAPKKAKAAKAPAPVVEAPPPDPVVAPPVEPSGPAVVVGGKTPVILRKPPPPPVAPPVVKAKSAAPPPPRVIANEKSPAFNALPINDKVDGILWQHHIDNGEFQSTGRSQQMYPANGIGDGDWRETRGPLAGAIKKKTDEAKAQMEAHELDAIVDYSGNGFGRMNSLLRHGEEDYKSRVYEGDPEAKFQALKKRCQDMTDGLAKLPKADPDMVLLRGERYAKEDIARVDELANADELVSDGFFSTTRDPRVATVFQEDGTGGKGYHVIYRIRKHANAHIVEGVSKKKIEREAVMPPGTRFKIVGRQRVNDRTLVVDLEEIVGS